MHSRPRCRHRQHDRSPAKLSETGDVRRRHRFPRHPCDLVRRRRNHEAVERERSRSAFAGSNRTARGDRAACDHELVLSQNLLGRLDSRP